MDDESWIFRNALDRLRGLGIRSVYICLDGKFDFIDHTLYRLPIDAGGSHHTELLAMLELVQDGMKRAAHEVLVLGEKCLDDYADPFFELTANLASHVFEYRGYEESTEVAVLQKKERDWQIDDGLFFQDVGFSSVTCSGSQMDVFEAWRPYSAISMNFAWDSSEGSVSISGNQRSIYYDALWPECVPAEVQALRAALSNALPTPAKSHPRSTWEQELVVDFKDKRVQFMQFECLEVQHEFCSGLMPLSELVWLSVTPTVLAPMSEEERTAWVATGAVQREITSEEVIAKIGIPEIESESDSVQGVESGEEPYQDDSDEFEEDSCYHDEIYLLSEELSEDQDAYARSEEDGWYYADD